MGVAGPRASTAIGRERELAALANCVAPGRGALLRARPGLGRTKLAAAVHDHARGLRHAPLWVSATATLQAVRFGTLAAALGGAIRPDRYDESSPRALTSLITALANHGGGAMTVLIIDDAHHLDDGSADVVLAAVNVGAIALIATVDGSAMLPNALQKLVSDGSVEVVDLQPLGRTEVARVVSHLLDGEVADATTELLWRWSGGSTSMLGAIVDCGTRDRRFRAAGGRWWWDGSERSERGALETLIDRRVDVLDQATSYALAAVALAGWLHLADADRVVDEGALARLERARLIVSSDRGSGLEVRVADELTAAAAERRLAAVQRRVLARRICDVVAPPSSADELARFARLQAFATDAPSPGLMSAAATMVRLSDPVRADRYAHLGCRSARTVQSVTTLLFNEVEAGNAVNARRYLHEARQLAPSPAHRAQLTEADFAISLFCECDHDRAGAILRSLEHRVPRWHTDSLRSLLALLAARADAAGPLARAVLDAPGAPDTVRLRAAVSAVGATLLGGETGAAQQLADRYLPLAESCATTMPTARSMLHAATSFSRLWRGELTVLPSADPHAGRWPCAPCAPTAPTASGTLSTPSGVAPPEGFTWALMAGIVAHLRGHHADAVARLREAAVEQSSGKRIFHAEALAWLVVALCDSGDRAGAEATLAAFPARYLAVLPGLVDWAAGVVSCAVGRPSDGARLLARAADAAASAGAPLCEARYLLDLTERCDTDDYLGRLDELAGRLDAPLLVELCRVAVARRKGDLHMLAEHAEALAGLGFEARAAAIGRDLARRARASGDCNLVSRANRLCRKHLGTKHGRDGTGLSPREAEVVDLAAGGLSDRQIAARLVVSVRTVESHLASAYRKLGVPGRTALADAVR